VAQRTELMVAYTYITHDDCPLCIPYCRSIITSQETAQLAAFLHSASSCWISESRMKEVLLYMRKTNSTQILL